MGKLGKLLLDEFDEFAGLEDTRENIEAPSEQLSKDGEYIQTRLHKMGIKTREQVDMLEEILWTFYDEDHV